MKADQNLNHSVSHVLAAAVLKLYPNTKVGFGPAIEEGFYYDFDFEKPISESNFIEIESEMRAIIKTNAKMQKVPMIDLNNPYKTELINEFKTKNEPITYYGIIDPQTKKSIFTDLCKGGHLASIGEIQHFKLLSVAGAYWRGDSKNKQLLRIYGTAWKTATELDAYLNLLKERKERDHRKIGKEMEIFMLHKDAIQGFPIWLNNGMAIKNEIQKYVREVEYQYGFREVETPAFGSKDLYIKSGHWNHYQDAMFPPLEVDNENLVMRPMTCPHHALIYRKKRRSYRDFPMRISEQSRLYRYEASGALSGLERVRSMMLTEGHIFARHDQIESEFTNCYNLILEVLKKFDIQIDYVSLSLRDKNDKEKYFNDDKMWEVAENQIKNVLNKMNVDYKEMKGEAAFYGPKVDIQVRTALGHEITLSTLQLDFLLPKRFDLTYTDQNEKQRQPVLIHRGLVGTYERFISILLEQTKGDLPFWLAPRQAVVIPITNEKHQQYAKTVTKKLLATGMRVNLDDRNERLNKKIRDAIVFKIKYQIVVGDNEVKTNQITIRKYNSKVQEKMTVPEFLEKVNKL